MNPLHKTVPCEQANRSLITDLLNPRENRNRHGFALVATLSLMILLVVIAVGLLSLSAVTLRNSGHTSAQAEARANARLALMIAIGELQQQMGPDQRISANGAILSDSTVMHPMWTGVWDSWIAGPLANAPTNPAYPSPESHHQTIAPPRPEQPEKLDPSMQPDYANKSKHFRRWLLSLNETEASNPESALSLVLDGVPKPSDTDNAIRLVGKGSLGDSAPSTDFVSARLIDVKATSASAGRGRYGWWVGDESQKARVMADSYTSTPPANDAEKIFRGQAPGSSGTKTIKDLEGITPAQEAKLQGLPTLNTLDVMVYDPDKKPSKQPAKLNFHAISPFPQSVLSDVREGGLKRDLSVILEQPIDLAYNEPEYMLYEFDDPRFPYANNPNDARRANSRVPIQDLAAYYQLYNHIPPTDTENFGVTGREGVQYTSAGLPNSLQIRVPDHDGGNKNRQRIIREYTSLYRQPVITKVQFLMGVTAQRITQAERDEVLRLVGRQNYNNLKPIRDTDEYKLRIGIQPMVTLWNPSNLPLVMDTPQVLRFYTPPFGLRWRKHREGVAQPYESLWMSPGHSSLQGGGSTSGGTTTGEALIPMRLGQTRIVFQPGEVKVFSIPSSQAANLSSETGGTLNLLTLSGLFNPVNAWDPFGVFLMRNSSPRGSNCNQAPDVIPFTLGPQAGDCMVFGPNDRISFSLDAANPSTSDGRQGGVEIGGTSFNLHMIDLNYSYNTNWQDEAENLRHSIMLSRIIGDRSNPPSRTFGRELMLPGFPGAAPIDYGSAIPGSQIIASNGAGEIIGLFDFSLSIGGESAGGAAGGHGGGRRIASRPFLHSASAALPFMAETGKDSLYDYGWDWQVSKINAVEDSIMQAKPGTGNGYYGGGYTVEKGTTHVIQSEIPVLPPISIAALSHAHLGGFSMAKAIAVGEIPESDKSWYRAWDRWPPGGVSFQRVTAAGQNGLAPHIVQAIGNSYAHPNIPADKAFVTKQRTFNIANGAVSVPYVDHSYLANKALWDEYFFSSMSPQPSKVELFGGTSRTARELADEFFTEGGYTLLPNRRMLPYKGNLDQSRLETLFSEANLFSNGLADKIASHLMVDGAFNVNSTSVDAWRVFFSGLRGKPVAYLESGKAPLESVSADKTVVNAVTLPNAKPVSTAAITSSNSPAEQWTAGRELTDEEIGELAEAMVKQVKLRGPFLSMSEFINRRLDGANTDGMALKGALQAALDDPDVSINAQFRTDARKLDAETAGIGFAFPDAAKGPIAYGSQPYVDQADVLRGLAEQLTPRGDTFVIRTYGDSIDKQGNVVARAWCEAVVQRVPDYVDKLDENHIRTASLVSEANRRFGRMFHIVSFRWLNPDEV